MRKVLKPKCGWCSQEAKWQAVVNDQRAGFMACSVHKSKLKEVEAYFAALESGK